MSLGIVLIDLSAESNVALALGLEIFILAQISSDMWLLEAFGER